ncbi:MAG: type II toxin-antitoxin system HipA family toxin [Rhodospirillales bacterium]
MPRRRRHTPLRVYLNQQFVGMLTKQPGGGAGFQYSAEWLAHETRTPISLSLPLRNEAYEGARVAAFFENLLPDSDEIRKRAAARAGAKGADAHSLLSAIGRDCVGALQFIPEDDEADPAAWAVEGEPVSGRKIEQLLLSLRHAPLGMNREDEFRISIAGVQEKTALLRHEGKWFKPHGATPTTHIFKMPIGQLPNGVDLSDSVENEFYCLKLMEAFGLSVNSAEIKTFGTAKCLVVERFDRLRAKDGRLLRLPQEDMCQALSIPPSIKYQSDGGPGMADVLGVLKGASAPLEDVKTFIKAQILFWLTGATDGHAKNFSIFLRPGGSYALTPLYDVITSQPYCDAGKVQRKNVRLAMSVGKSRHYRMEEIMARHFVQTGERAGLPKAVVLSAAREIIEAAGPAMTRLERALPKDFPEALHVSVKKALERRLQRLEI